MKVYFTTFSSGLCTSEKYSRILAKLLQIKRNGKPWVLEEIVDRDSCKELFDEVSPDLEINHYILEA